MKTNKSIRVLVGMSGGVDSSVAALLLQKQGFEVIGAFMKNWSFPADSPFAKSCTWKEDWRSAVRVAAKLDIPFLTFDFQKEYAKGVIDYFFVEYEKGRTPNPDVMCNKIIKFDLFLKAGQKLGADFIATGHYVRKIEDQKLKKFKLLKGIDPGKDQSYFLWTLTQKQIQNSLFPIGDYTKKQVREIAARAKLASAHRPDSQGICFVGEVDVPKFIASRLSPKEGEVLYKNKVVGKHKGVQFYTIGQRKGLDDPVLQKNLAKLFPNQNLPPLYVTSLDATKNQIQIGEEKALFKSKMKVRDLHWLAGELPKTKKLSVKIRYQHSDIPCQIKKISSKQIQVQFIKPVRAITPGQSAVFYSGEEMLGGGIIE